MSSAGNDYQEETGKNGTTERLGGLRKNPESLGKRVSGGRLEVPEMQRLPHTYRPVFPWH